jgi:hypothetical protein
MTFQDFTSIVSIATSIFLGVIVYNFTKKKDFQEKLYEQKCIAYQDLLQGCFEYMEKLNMSKEPFRKMYEYTSIEDWQTFCLNGDKELLEEGYTLMKKIHKYYLFIPKKNITMYTEFIKDCLLQVNRMQLFNSKLIIEHTAELIGKYYDLLNGFREDLKIDLIDDALTERLKLQK